jgi:hypothetical protein
MPDMTPARIRLALAWTTVGPNQLFPVGLAERGVLLRQGALLAHASSVRAASPSRRTIDGGGNPHRPRVEFRVSKLPGHFLAGLAISSLVGTQVGDMAAMPDRNHVVSKRPPSWSKTELDPRVRVARLAE